MGCTDDSTSNPLLPHRMKTLLSRSIILSLTGRRSLLDNGSMVKEMKANVINFRVEFCVEKDGDGYYAYCPALDGVHVGGDTKEEAIENAQDAAIAYIESLIKHNDPIPLDFTETEEGKRSSKIACPASQRYT